MKKCNINRIMGGEVLATPVMTNQYQILLSEGTVLQKEYIDKIRELGITEVCIWEEGEKEKSKEINVVRKEALNKLTDKIKKILERHIYQENQELRELNNAAEMIVEAILKEEKVVEQIIETKNKSADIYEHSVSCCALSTILGLKLGMSQEMLNAIGTGCLLHDIGLRFMSVKYEDTELEEMSEKDRSEYKKHSVYGYSSLEKESWLNDISKNIILLHHERMDGSGYPFKSRVVSDAIGIMSVCDTFDEMISGIGYRPLKTYSAVEYLKSFKNTKFNGKIIDEFLKIITLYSTGSRLLLNTGETAVVVGQNKGFPERPIIRIIKDKDGKNLKETCVRDLMQDKYIFIDRVIE